MKQNGDGVREVFRLSPTFTMKMDSVSSDHSPPLSENAGSSWMQCWENEISSVSGINSGKEGFSFVNSQEFCTFQSFFLQILRRIHVMFSKFDKMDLNSIFWRILLELIQM